MSATENEAPDVPIASAATSNAEKTGDKLLPAKAGKTAAKAKKKGTAKRKDKNKPKRPLSAYNYFFKEERKRMLAILRGEKGAVNDPKSKNYVPEETLKILLDKKGHVVFPEMAKVVASHWKNVGDEEGARLRALAKEDLDRYNKEMQKYQLQEIPSPPQPHALADQMGRQGAQYAAPYGAYPTDVALAAPHYMMPMAPMMHQPQHAAGAYSYHPHEAAGGYHHPSLLGSPNMYYGGGPSPSPPGGPYGAVQYSAAGAPHQASLHGWNQQQQQQQQQEMESARARLNAAPPSGLQQQQMQSWSWRHRGAPHAGMMPSHTPASQYERH